MQARIQQQQVGLHRQPGSQGRLSSVKVPARHTERGTRPVTLQCSAEPILAASQPGGQNVYLVMEFLPLWNYKVACGKPLPLSLPSTNTTHAGRPDSFPSAQQSTKASSSIHRRLICPARAPPPAPSLPLSDAGSRGPSGGGERRQGRRGHGLGER